MVLVDERRLLHVYFYMKVQVKSQLIIEKQLNILPIYSTLKQFSIPFSSPALLNYLMLISQSRVEVLPDRPEQSGTVFPELY